MPYDKNRKAPNPYYRREESQDFGTGKPEPRKGDAGALLDFNMIRELPMASSAIQTKVDPYASDEGSGSPYRAYNRNCRILNPVYEGNENLDGSSAMQIYNEDQSALLNYFDVVRMSLRTNYRYMSIKPRMNGSVDQTNYGLISSMFKAFIEKMEEIEASTFTDISAFSYIVTTSLPTSPDPEHDKIWSPYVIKINNVIYYTEYAAVFLLMLEYQLIMQRAASVFCSVNKERAYRSHFKTMGYNREASYLAKLWGRFNSGSWLANWTTLATNLEGEWFDLDWLHQTNILAMLLSRKSNSIIDPICDLVVLGEVPTSFKCWSKVTVDDNGTYVFGSVVFDSALLDIASTSGVRVVKPFGTYPISSSLTSISFDSVCQKLVDYMDPSITCAWARINFQKATGDFSNIEVATVQEYSNTITNLLTCLDQAVSYTKACMTNLKKVIGICKRVGINQWARTSLGIVKGTECDILYNTTVSDLMANYLTGAETVTVNDKTMRWTSYTIFNKYYGIPAYDFKTGGSFVTFSLKNIDANVGSERLRYVPYLFGYPTTSSNTNNYDFESNTVTAISRYGELIAITTNGNLDPHSNNVYARLAPIGAMDGVRIRIPQNANSFPTPTNERGIGSRATVSAFYHLLENLFHLGRVRVSSAYDYILSSDIMMLTDFEISDLTNMIIAYARSSGPIITNGTKVNLGFSVRS